MNYVCAVYGILVVVMAVDWVIRGRKAYNQGKGGSMEDVQGQSGSGSGTDDGGKTRTGMGEKIG